MAGNGGTGMGIPLKLQRYLMTISRRQRIDCINIAAVIVADGRLAVECGALPKGRLEGDDIEGALESLGRRLKLRDFCVKRYVGYFDRPENGKVIRQYNFEMGVCPPATKELDLVDAGSCRLTPEEAKIVETAMGKRQ